MSDPAWPPHDPAAIEGFARDLAGRLGIGRIACVPWKEGASNAIWSVEPEGAGPGDRFVLKVGKLPRWRRLGVEAGILAALGGREAPRLVAHGMAGDGLPWDWALLERVEGEHLFTLGEAEARRLGELLRSAREATRGLELGGGSWLSFVEERIKRPLATAAKSMDPRVSDRFARLLDRALSMDAAGELLDSLPGGISHGDLTPLNLLFEPGGNPRLLDWESPRRASAAWDVAGVRKAFRLEEGAFAALVAGVGEALPAAAIDFADALQQLQVAAWRADAWFARGQRAEGAFFLVEMGEELGRAELLLGGLRRTAKR